MKAIQQLIAYFESKGKISPSQLQQLVSRGYWGQYAAGDLRSLEQKIGQSFFFQVTADAQGPLWGTDTYTSDSNLGAACIHGGLLQSGESGVVRVTIVTPISTYHGSTRHGVTSHPWTSGWSGAFRVTLIKKEAVAGETYQ